MHLFHTLQAVSYPAQLASGAASSTQLYPSLVHVSDHKRAHIKEHQNWPRAPGRLNNHHTHVLAQGLTSAEALQRQLLVPSDTRPQSLTEWSSPP